MNKSYCPIFKFRFFLFIIFFFLQTIILPFTMLDHPKGILYENNSLKQKVAPNPEVYPGFYKKGNQNSTGKMSAKQAVSSSFTSPRETAAVRQNALNTGKAEKVLVIPVQFSDVKFEATHNQAYFQKILDEMKEYYEKNSGYYFDHSKGITIDYSVAAVVTSSRSMSYYGADLTPGGDDKNTNVYELAREAIQLLDSQLGGFDFAPFDTNDADTDIDHIFIIHAGNGQEDSAVEEDIWSHRWSIQDGQTVDGVVAYGYSCVPESGTLGVFAHEFGHDIGLPDLYDNNGITAGVGDWDIMGSGSWNHLPGQLTGTCPANLSAWSRLYMGWTSPQVITTDGSHSIRNSMGISDVVALGKNGVVTGDEYYLVEYRRNVDYDAALPGEGLLIWHVDNNYISKNISDNLINTNENRQGLSLEQADGQDDLWWYCNSGDGGDPFPGETANKNFTSIPYYLNWSNVDNSNFLFIDITDITVSDNRIDADFFFNEDIPQVAPSLSLPITNGIESVNPLFCWGIAPQSIIYELQISESSNFSDFVTSFTFSDLTSGLEYDGSLYSYRIPSSTSLTRGKTYYWRVAGINTLSTESNLVWSQTRSFTIPAPLPAPSVTFSFDGENANKLMGSATNMEYSLDGGVTYVGVASSDVSLTSNEIASITSDNNILIRLKENGNIPAGLVKTIDILPGNALSNVHGDDSTNTMTGISTSMEFSTDNLNWTRYNNNLPDLTQNLTLYVRYCAAGQTLHGIASPFYFTKVKPAAPNISFSFSGSDANRMMGTTALMEYSLDGGKTYTSINENNQQLTQQEIENLTYMNGISIRLKAAAGNPPSYDCHITLYGGVNAPIVTGNNKMNTVSGINASMEFSTDGYTWTKYNNNLPDLSGYVTLYVRYSAYNLYLPSNICTLIFTAENLESGYWSAISNLPDGLTGTSVLLNGQIYFIGNGADRTNISIKKVYIYDQSVNQWIYKNSFQLNRTSYETVAANGKIYFIGGLITPEGNYSPAVEEYDPITNLLTAKLSMPVARESFVAVEYNGIIYVTGGGINSGTNFNRLDVYDPVKDQWTTSASVPELTNWEFDGVGLDGKIYLLGDNENSNSSMRLNIYDIASNTWTYEVLNNLSMREAYQMVAIDSFIYVLGGYVASDRTGTPGIFPSSSSVLRYSPETNAWDTVASMLHARNDFSAIALNNNIYAIGGNETGSWVIQGEYFTLPAPAPASPNIDFSFSGQNAGKLIGLTTSMEFSLDGGTSYIRATSNDQLLTVKQLEAISSFKDIKIRIAGTTTSPVGKIQTIDILDAGLPQWLVANDNVNNIQGMDQTMEFSMDGGSTWTRYDGTNMPELSGDVTLWIRKVAYDHYQSSSPQIYFFTAANPDGTISASFKSPPVEGLENNSVIRITLLNRKFASNINLDAFVLSGLPVGISKGNVTRISDTIVEITLVGNSTADYDTSQYVTINVNRNQVTVSQTATLSSIVVLPATIEPKPGTPTNITFSFDGLYAGRLVGITSNDEYSLDGGIDYVAAYKFNQLLSSNELSLINDSNDIRCRVSGDLRTPASDVWVINILHGPSAPSVVGNDDANTVSGMSSEMEYSTDGRLWTKFSNNLPNLTGNATLLVRYAATGVTMYGDVRTLTFTETVTPPPGGGSEGGGTGGAGGGGGAGASGGGIAFWGAIGGGILPPVEETVNTPPPAGFVVDVSTLEGNTGSMQGGNIVVSIPKDAAEPSIVIEAGLFSDMEEKKMDLTVNSPEISMTIPEGAIDSRMLETADVNTWLKISMNTVEDENSKKVLGDAVKDDGNGLFAIGGKLFEFGSALISGDKTQIITSFKTSVTITISLKGQDMKNVDPDKLGVYWYNETSKTWEYMGGVYDPRDSSVTFTTSHFSLYSVMEYEVTFSDIVNHYARAAIERMASKHIAKGVSENKFNPNGTIKRMDFVALLVRALGLKEEFTGTLPYNDLKSGNNRYNEMGIAFKAGIIQKSDGAMFRPDANITREEMAVMIVRALRIKKNIDKLTDEQVNKKLSIFKDAREIAPASMESVATAVDRKIITGRTKFTFVPKATATRAEAIIMIERLLSCINNH